VNIIRLAPPLCITEAELDQSIDIIASCLKDITSMKKEDVPNALGV
jgi:ornithine--oxo-acid transaminase